MHVLSCRQQIYAKDQSTLLESGIYGECLPVHSYSLERYATVLGINCT